MLARRRVDNPQIVPINSNQNDPFLNYGFYSYAIAQPSYGIYVNGGALRVTDAASLGGTWSNLNSDGLVTGPMMITGLPAASEGYIILKYGQIIREAGIGGPPITTSLIDFGDPAKDYYLFELSLATTRGANSHFRKTRQGHLACHIPWRTPEIPTSSSAVSSANSKPMRLVCPLHTRST